MTSSALFDTMAQQVEAECRRNLEEAQREADAILAEAREKSAALSASALEATRAEMESLKQRWVQKAEAEAAKADSIVKKEAVDRVLAEVQRKIDSIVGSADFTNVLDALLSELMAAVDEDVVLLAPEAHIDHVKKWLASNGRGKVVIEASAALPDGVAAQDAGRTYRVSNALATRLRRMEQEIRKESMDALFGQGT